MATPEMLAAVSAAVKGEEIPDMPAAAEPAEPAAQEPAASEPPAVAAPKEDLIGTPPPNNEPPQLDEHGRMRGPDGKFIAATPKAAEPAAPAAPAPAEPAAAAPPPKPLDPVNDPVPANAKPETKERITTLANLVKEERAQRDTLNGELTTVKGDLEMLLAPIKEAGASVEQFREAMDLVKFLNSPHQHEQQQALQILQTTLAGLSERLGVVPPGVDPLAGQADLIEQVRANPALRPMLEEVAKARRLTAATQQHQQQAQQRSQQTQAQQQAIQSGQAAVKQVEQTLEATDPQYKAKVAVLRADTAFMSQMRGLHPTQWAAAFAEKYRTVQVLAAPAAPAPVAAAAPGRPASPSPLRPNKQPAGGTNRPPATMLEAVSGALRSARA